MKRAPTSLALISALAVSSALLAQQTPAPAPPAQEATPMPAPPTRSVESGFTSLFNGKDLTGWKIGGPANRSRWIRVRSWRTVRRRISSMTVP